MSVKVHAFASSGEAYDTSQCDDSIKDGDVLFVPSEGQVAIMYHVAWPCALLDADTKFDRFTDEYADWHEINREYGESLATAFRLVRYMPFYAPKYDCYGYAR